MHLAGAAACMRSCARAPKIKRVPCSMSRYQGQRRFGTEMAPPIGWIQGEEDPEKRLNETFAYHTTTMANTLGVPVLVFTQTGNMPALLSHYRPNEQIFAFTDCDIVRRRMALYHAVTALKCDFQQDSKQIVQKALKARLSIRASYLCLVFKARAHGSHRGALLMACSTRCKCIHDALLTSDCILD
jgi:Pyruvate kinase, alpha/beta domain